MTDLYRPFVPGADQFRPDPQEIPSLMPPGVQRLGGKYGPQLGGPGANNGLGVLDVREINRYPQVITGSLAVPAVSTFILSQPAGLRLVFGIRNPLASVGTVYVSFGIAASPATGAFELSPGVQVYLDTVVPQDDVYVIATGGAATITWFYGDSPI